VKYLKLNLFAVTPAGKIRGYLNPGASEVFAKTQMIEEMNPLWRVFTKASGL
jgi:hypothetical protein